MYIYKFEKGSIKVGTPCIKEEDYEFFERNFGKFKKLYNDNKHTDEELEPQYVFIITSNSGDGYRLILAKDEDEILNMEIAEDEHRRAWITDIDYLDDKPINAIVEDGLFTWTEERYIGNDGREYRWNGYIEII